MMNKVIRKKVYDLYKGHCAYCGKKITIEQMQIDHVVPLRRNDCDEFLAKHGIVRGTDSFDNLKPSCRSCNFRKGEMPLEKFREELIFQRDNIVKRSFQVRQSIDYGLIQIINKPVVFYFEKLSKDGTHDDGAGEI